MDVIETAQVINAWRNNSLDEVDREEGITLPGLCFLPPGWSQGDAYVTFYIGTRPEPGSALPLSAYGDEPYDEADAE